MIPDVPFSSLLTPRQNSTPPLTPMTDSTIVTKTAVTVAANDTNNGNNERMGNDNTTSKCNSQNGSRRSSCSITSANDDFIMVDLVISYLLDLISIRIFTLSGVTVSSLLPFSRLTFYFLFFHLKLLWFKILFFIFRKI